MAQELDNKELEWICPKCVREDTKKLAGAHQPLIMQVKVISVAYSISTKLIILIVIKESTISLDSNGADTVQFILRRRSRRGHS